MQGTCSEGGVMKGIFCNDTLTNPESCHIISAIRKRSAADISATLLNESLS